MSGLYSKDEITKYIIEKFDLYIGDSASSKQDFYKRYYHQVYRTMIRLGINDEGQTIINPNSKRKCKFYTEGQLQTIIHDKNFFKYICSNSNKDIIKNREYYNRIIEERQSDYIDSLSNGSNEAQDIPALSNSNFLNIKNSIMIEALFRKFFTPIDEVKLRNDLELYQSADIMDLTVEDISVEERLNHPEGNYYIPLKKDS